MPKITYSAHGSHLFDNRLRVYHQGGLDNYCGFYAILNLVNFLKLKEKKKKEYGDFIGASEKDLYENLPKDGQEEGSFWALHRLIDAGVFRSFFPERPFGDYSPEAPMLVEALSRALLFFNLRWEAKIEEDQFRDPYDEKNWKNEKKNWNYLRPGTEKAFKQPDDVLGLAVVKEDKEDKVGHWVVFIGKNHLKDIEINCEADWKGIVLDSDRGYERWKVCTDSATGLPRIFVRTRRDAEETKKSVEWIYSFVSVTLDRPK